MFSASKFVTHQELTFGWEGRKGGGLHHKSKKAENRLTPVPRPPNPLPLPPPPPEEDFSKSSYLFVLVRAETENIQTSRNVLVKSRLEIKSEFNITKPSGPVPQTGSIPEPSRLFPDSFPNK